MSPVAHQLEEALAAAGSVDSIRIDLQPDRTFVWRLYSAGEEIFAGTSGPEDVPGMLLSTEVLINTEFGIERRRLCLPAMN